MRKNGQMSDARERNTVAYLRPRLIMFVFLGGIAGVLAREWLMVLVPPVSGLPTAVSVANMLGAFLMGVLVEVLAGHGGESSRAQSIRLFIGTGVLGGFTTYSAIAQTVVLLRADGEVWVGVGYAFASVVLGVIFSWCGMLLGGRVRKYREHRDRVRSGDERHG